MYQYFLLFNTNKSPKNPYTLCVKLDFCACFCFFVAFLCFWYRFIYPNTFIYIYITKALVGVEVARLLLGGTVGHEVACSSSVSWHQSRRGFFGHFCLSAGVLLACLTYGRSLSIATTKIITDYEKRHRGVHYTVIVMPITKPPECLVRTLCNACFPHK